MYSIYTIDIDRNSFIYIIQIYVDIYIYVAQVRHPVDGGGTTWSPGGPRAISRVIFVGPSEENDGLITVFHRDFIKNRWYFYGFMVDFYEFMVNLNGNWIKETWEFHEENKVFHGISMDLWLILWWRSW